MVKVDRFVGEDIEFAKSYRVFLTKHVDFKNGDSVYSLHISIEDVEQDLGTYKMPLTTSQYFKMVKEPTIRKVVKVFYEVVRD
ncbi:hypothetical protein [Bacillus mycoides]|uniref:hypothetical protein n=1 Tax=Bacillus mycoides TaxID=1405 RepID=UPI003A8069F2